ATSEEHDAPSGAVIRHHRILAGRRTRRRRPVDPRCSIPLPCVIQLTCRPVAPEEDDAPPRTVVGHCMPVALTGARRRYLLGPDVPVPLPHIGHVEAVVTSVKHHAAPAGVVRHRMTRAAWRTHGWCFPDPGCSGPFPCISEVGTVGTSKEHDPAP